MKWDVKVYVAGNTFIESVYANNRSTAIDTAKARNPHARYAYIMGYSNSK